MPFEFTISDFIPASPQEIFDAWLDNTGHEKITGGQPATITPVPNAAFIVWNGFISGRNLKLERPYLIVQSWRTTRFTKDDADSQIEIRLEAVAAGTKITLRHTNVPDSQTSYRDGGWQRSYFDPMKAYFSSRRRALDEGQ
jgi:activator of HSP90 ATPase